MPASACCVLCYSKFMESTKQLKLTLVEIPQVFVSIIIFIFIMSGIMALTQFPFNPFAFIQSYYAWIIGFVVLGYLQESGIMEIIVNIIEGIFKVLLYLLLILLSPFYVIFFLLYFAWVMLGTFGLLGTIGAGF